MNILSRLKKEKINTTTDVQRWKSMYEGEGNILNLPAAIASELARLATIEMKTSLSGGAGKVCNKAIRTMNNKFRINTELACALGGGMFRPYCDGSELRVEFFPADRFTVTAFSEDGEPCGCIFHDVFSEDGIYYTRLEEHAFMPEGYVITNRAYKGHSPESCTVEIPLDAIPKWAYLEKKCIIKNIDKPLFVYFCMPVTDNSNPEKKLGASVFARAEKLIAQADRQFERLLWEFEGGELAIDASADALKFNEKGTYGLPKLNHRLFRGLGIDAGDRDLYTVFSPALRDTSIINGLNEILMRIEDACGLARGTFSNAPAAAKTATEIKILKQRSYATVCDLQREIRKVYEGVCSCLGALALLYGLTDSGECSISIEFDDSIVTDREAEFEEKIRLVGEGIMSKEEFRSWYFGEENTRMPEKLKEQKLE